MQQQLWQIINDLTVLFSARIVALPLMVLLVYKIYSIAPSALVYLLALVVLTSLFAMRWSLQLILNQQKAFVALYQQVQQRRKK